MKKKCSFILLLSVLSLNLSAQDYQKAIGLRLGSNNEIDNFGITYKQFLSSENAIEIIGNASFLGRSKYFGLSGEYLWSWNLAEGFSWFAGPGASIGAWTTGDFSGFNIALNGMIGLEYKFNIPLALSLDINPHLYFLHGAGISPFTGALSVRYTL